jgi:hypothetical protein
MRHGRVEYAIRKHSRPVFSTYHIDTNRQAGPVLYYSKKRLVAQDAKTQAWPLTTAMATC